MSAQHTAKTQQNSSTKKAPFQGVITRLLQEAFYLEEEQTLALQEGESPFEPEEECERFEFIRQLLGPLSTS
jgi:multidrug efflux pump subunit AcrA (membrane-fusion protein)